MSKSIRENDINHLIGKLEVIAAAAEPGTVLTAHMAGFCNETLLNYHTPKGVWIPVVGDICAPLLKSSRLTLSLTGV